MNKIRIISVVILCLLVVVAGLFYIYSLNDDKNRNQQDREAMINIALSDDVFKWYLNNLTYNVTMVDLANEYVLFDLGKGSAYWERVMVGVDRANNKTMYVYLIGTNNKSLDVIAKMMKIALQNDTVKSYVKGRRYNINNANTSTKQVIFDVGNMTESWGHVFVGVDINNNRTTYVTYMPQTPLVVPTGNASSLSGNTTLSGS